MKIQLKICRMQQKLGLQANIALNAYVGEEKYLK